MKLSEYAKEHGISYRTAITWFHAGKIEGAYQEESGTIRIRTDDREELIKLQRERIEALEKELAETKKKEL